MTQSLRWFASLALLLVATAATGAAQQSAQIKGKVMSPEGAPLGGASIVIQELGLGATVARDGSYEVIIPGARVATGQPVNVLARLVGYKAVRKIVQLVAGTIEVNFTLESNPLQLGEIVVTGGGTATTVEKLGNVRTTVDTLLIARSSESNIVNAMAGKAANVEVYSQSGEPGASSYIRMRGVKTLQGTGQPLFIVDGVPIDNTTFSTGANTASTVTPNRASDINPADIESIEILKGASAAAIYGSRAGQGVVLITTKSGKAGPTRASLRTSMSMDNVNRLPDLQSTYGQGSGGVAAKCTSLNCALTSGSWGAKLDPSVPIYDHTGEMFDTGTTWDNVLTVSGGNDRTTFFLSGGFMAQQGMIIGPSNEYNKTTVRVNASHRISNRFKVGANVAYVNTDGKYVQKGSNVSGLLLGAWRTPPEFDNSEYLDAKYGLHRSYRRPNPGPTSATSSRGYDNPFFVVNKPINTSALGRGFGNVSAEWITTDWLTIAYTLGADYSNDERIEGLPQTSTNFPQGQVIAADFTTFLIDHSLTANARFKLTNNISGAVTVGQNLNARKYTQIYSSGQVLIEPYPLKISNTVTALPSNNSEAQYHGESYYAQANFDFYSQLYVTGSIRNDGSSTFGVDNRRAWFPRGSVAWNFIREGENAGDVISFGKVRAAYGEVGQEPGAYLLQTVFAPGAYGDGWVDFGMNSSFLGRPGLKSDGTAGNPNLKPERTTEFETGVDVGMFRDKLDVSLTYYDATSKDVILLAPLPPSSGFTNQVKNTAKLRNKGFETTVNIRPVNKRNFGFDFGIIWAKNDNEVLDLGGLDFVDYSNGSFTGAQGAAVLGQQVGVLRGNDFARCGITAGIDCPSGVAKGTLYIGADGLPILDQEVRVIANPNPDWTGGLRANVRYKGLQLSALVDHKQGGQVWNGTRGALYNFGKHADTDIRDRTDIVFGTNFQPQPVMGPGAGKQVQLDQGWFQGNGSGFGPVSAQFMENGTFTKLREVSLVYTADQRWVKNSLGMSSIDLRVSGRNLWIKTDYRGIDPETNLAGAETGLRGIDYFNNPFTRSWVFSITLNR